MSFKRLGLMVVYYALVNIALQVVFHLGSNTALLVALFVSICAELRVMIEQHYDLRK